jgi:hypothetical protein
MTAITDLPAAAPVSTPKAMRWAGYVLTGVSAAFLAMDASIKLVPLEIVNQTMDRMGLPRDMSQPIGIIELVALALYLFPRTATLGAILFTGVMGGAIASHMRIDDPLFSHTLFGVYLGAMIWGGIWLRDARLRSLVPFRR